jgi:hypothetical protein
MTWPLAFTVTATGSGGTSTAKVTVTQLVDRVVVTQATYRTLTREWRVGGTATGPPPDLVTVRLGQPTPSSGRPPWPDGSWGPARDGRARSGVSP